jgi:antitoxin component YwqK of YwqJK toxin-antitoxin module
MKKNMINQRDKNGKRHGLWEDRYTNGYLYNVGNFTHGKMNGPFIYYFYNSSSELRPRMKCEFKNDARDGFTIIYSGNGVVDLQGFKKNNVYVGLWYYNMHND